MPFRIPRAYRQFDVASADPGHVNGGDLDDYIAWLKTELYTAMACKRDAQATAKASRQAAKKKEDKE